MKQKKIPLWGKLGIAAGVVLLIGAAAFFLVQGKLNRISRVDQESAGQNQSAEEDLDINGMKDKEVINILLIGQDRREGQARQRSDSMILCSINKARKKIILTSIMRDLYVPIPGYSDNRINAAYQFGGMPLLDQVIEESLGVHVDGNVEVDFEGFVTSMAALGNLEIELSQAEADYMNRNGDGVEQPDPEGTPWNLKAGVNALSPSQLLAYSRIRYVGNSDWERTERQRRVLMAAFEKAKKQGLAGMLALADQVFPNLTTDMTNGQILRLLYTVLASGITEVESYRIPAEGTYTNETLKIGMEVLVPDLEENSQALQKWIYGEESISGTERM